MTQLFIMLSVSILTIILMFVALILGEKSNLSIREKATPFECGFDPKSSARLSFSLRFFLIIVLFLVFDVEIVLFLPLIMNLNLKLDPLFWFITSSSFLGILLLGLYYEWKQGALEWVK